MQTHRIPRLTVVVLAGLIFAGALPACSDSSDSKKKKKPFVFNTDPINLYSQIDRKCMPGVNTAVITSKDAYNVDDPLGDVAGTYVAEITSNIDALHTALDDDLTGLSLTPCLTADCVAAGAPLIIPDTIKIDTLQPAGFPNGRGPADQAMDITLAVLLLDLNTHPVDLLASLPLNPAANDLPFQGSFPYLAAPH